MAIISTKLHAAADYRSAVSMLCAPFALRGEDLRGRGLLGAAGAGALLTSALTDYELGVRRRLPMKAHLVINAATGAVLVAGGLALRRSGAAWRLTLGLTAVGAREIAGALLTEREPGDRAGKRGAPGAVPGVSGEGPAVQTPRSDGPPVAPPPTATPGPATPPHTPEPETEREERAGEFMPDRAPAAAGDAFAIQEEAAAAAEAARIGGVVPAEVDDPALEPVHEAGGGEQDGGEAVERDLIENATHGDGFAQPEGDAFTPELESDRAGAVYGEADSIASTEVIDDPAAPPEMIPPRVPEWPPTAVRSRRRSRRRRGA